MRGTLAALAAALMTILARDAVSARATPVTAPTSTWLVVSDIHYMPFGRLLRETQPSHAGQDTDPVLLDSLFAELVRAVPNPPVVVIAGDFLGHGFPTAHAAATMAYLAQRFGRAYPHAQFVITLGNNDSACGDYESTIDGPFLRAVAHAWEPLVNRNGAAPDFVRTFAHDGAYVARLPIAHLRAIALNDVYATVRYRNACSVGNGAGIALGDIARALHGGPRGERTWIVTHVPPGIDAYSTAHLAHGLFVVPFLRPGARERFTNMLSAQPGRVPLVIAGHTHHFAFRLTPAARPSDRIPILVAPSVSPIFRNAPSFLTLAIANDGTVLDVTERSLVNGAWVRLGDLAEQGVARFDAPELIRYQGRLERDARLRAAFTRLYAGGGSLEIDDGNWSFYRCAAVALSAAAFDRCTGGGAGVVTTRGLFALGGAAATALLAVTLGVTFLVRRRRGRSGSLAVR